MYFCIQLLTGSVLTEIIVIVIVINLDKSILLLIWDVLVCWCTCGMCSWC